MKIVIDYPPMMDEIHVVMGTRGQAILYAWGDTIYNPMGTKIPIQLYIHEQVHEKQQAGKPELWWKSYLASPKFRLDMELPAHRAEYVAYCRLGNNRRARRIYLNGIARRLSGPLYGGLISRKKAKELIHAALA